MIDVEACYIELREPSFDPRKKGRLLGYFDPRRAVLKLKRADGPEMTFDLAAETAKFLQSVTQEPGSVL